MFSTGDSLSALVKLTPDSCGETDVKSVLRGTCPITHVDTKSMDRQSNPFIIVSSGIKDSKTCHLRPWLHLKFSIYESFSQNKGVKMRAADL